MPTMDGLDLAKSPLLVRAEPSSSTAECCSIVFPAVGGNRGTPVQTGGTPSTRLLEERNTLLEEKNTRLEVLNHTLQEQASSLTCECTARVVETKKLQRQFAEAGVEIAGLREVC